MSCAHRRFAFGIPAAVPVDAGGCAARLLCVVCEPRPFSTRRRRASICEKPLAATRPTSREPKTRPDLRPPPSLARALQSHTAHCRTARVRARRASCVVTAPGFLTSAVPRVSRRLTACTASRARTRIGAVARSSRVAGDPLPRRTTRTQHHDQHRRRCGEEAALSKAPHAQCCSVRLVAAAPAWPSAPCERHPRVGRGYRPLAAPPDRSGPRTSRS